MVEDEDRRGNQRRHRTQTVDVAIVGGGVAGASLAAVLATTGMGVALIEREPCFRDRVRGESIHPWGVREADRLGLLPVLRAAGPMRCRCGNPTSMVCHRSPITGPRTLLTASESGRSITRRCSRP